MPANVEAAESLCRIDAMKALQRARVVPFPDADLGMGASDARQHTLTRVKPEFGNRATIPGGAEVIHGKMHTKAMFS
jgi:hypothetical protein